MKYDPYKHHRRSIRLKGYDYTQEGAYFVTISSKNGEPIFGHVENDVMILNEWGLVVQREWEKTAVLRSNVNLGVSQIMPTHFHGVLWIWKPFPHAIKSGLPRQFGRPEKESLGTIVGAFKSAVTYGINKLRQVKGVSVWHRNYFEQIIRNEEHLTAVSQYIINNPATWESDKLHPDAPLNKFNRAWREGK